MNKTLKNILYVFAQQFVNTVLPFMTIPYVARVLGIVQNGIYSYSQTIVNVFAVVFALGFAVHGANTIAQTRESEQKVKYVEIQMLRMAFLLIGLILFISYIYFYPLQYNKEIFLLQGLVILINFFDNSWYYQGLGNFKKIVTRNIMVKLVGNLCVFLFVKSPEDLWIYILLLNGSQLIGNSILFIDNIKYFKFIKLVNRERLFMHTKVACILFLPNVSVLVFSSFDRILLGSTGEIEDLSNYQQVQRLITFMYSLLMIPSPVLIQKIAKFRATSNNRGADFIISRALNMYIILGTLFCFGVLLTAHDFIYLFLGQEYYGAIILFIILSPALVLKTIAGVIGGWYLIPLGRNLLHSTPLIIATLISILLNILITPMYGAISSACIFVFTEILIVTIQFYYSRSLLEYINKKILIGFLILYTFVFLFTVSILKIISLPENVIFSLLVKMIVFLGICLGLSWIIKPLRNYIKEIPNLIKRDKYENHSDK